MKKTLLVTLLIAAFALLFAGCNAEEVLSDVGVKKDAGTKDTGTCTPNCDGKACGDPDDCGGQCVGSCPEGKTCNPNNYTCEIPNICTEGSKQCSGTKVQTCTSGAWVDGEDCATSGKTCDNGECKIIPGCTEGAKQCSGTKVQTCTSGAWVDGEDCAASGKTCQNGACVCTPNCNGKACGDSDGCGGKCVGSCPNGQTCNPNTYTCENPSTCTEGSKQCSGTKVQTCTNGAWVDGEDCAASQKVCQNGACVTSGNCAQPEGAACNIDNKPCCETLSCVTLFNDQKDSKCYKDCINDQNVCSSTQQCIGISQTEADCFEVTTIANGTFSKCPSYADGEEPGQNDPTGTASIKFTLGGISYNFTICTNDSQIIDQDGNVWLVDLIDGSKYSTKKIIYVYRLIFDNNDHTVGDHELSQTVGTMVLEFHSSDGKTVDRAVVHSLGVQGTIKLTQVGTGNKAPTTGTITNMTMMGYDYVACDNAAGKTCQ